MKIDIDDIENKLEKYNDYFVKEVTKIDNTYSLIAVIQNAFFIVITI